MVPSPASPHHSGAPHHAGDWGQCTAGVMCQSQAEGTASIPALKSALVAEAASLHYVIPGFPSALPARWELVLLLTGEGGRALGKVRGVFWPCKTEHPCVFRKKMLEGISW